MSDELYLHVKTGHTYLVIATAIMEWLYPDEAAACVVYTDYPNRKHSWVRTASEFFDGRFVKLDNEAKEVVDQFYRFDPLADIEEFHKKYGLKPNNPMGALDTEVAKFRYEFLLEEINEWLNHQGAAYDETTLPSWYRSRENYEYHLEGALDGLIDLAYVLFGTVYLHGFSEAFEEGWRRVHEANMKKVRAECASDSKRGSSFDVIKPPGWVAPDHHDLITDNDVYDPHPGRA